jgi:formamidopyrimidine-DNA glycosylase
MPELPDVELYRRYLDATSLHQPFDHVEVEALRVLEDTTPQALGRRLKGHRLEDTRRHGKYLFATLDSGGALVLHFGMTGRLEYSRKAHDPPRHTACLFHFGNGGQLAYVAPRKLGHVALTDSPAHFIEDRALGPDALEIDWDTFRAAAGKRRGGVKSWLMDQQRIAGIGNVYSDEILFQAGIHPKQAVRDLDDDELRDLHRAIREVLTAAIEAKADPEHMPPGFLLPHRGEGGRCPRCRTGVKKIRASGRTAWYCPACQPL